MLHNLDVGSRLIDYPVGNQFTIAGGGRYLDLGTDLRRGRRLFMQLEAMNLLPDESL